MINRILCPVIIALLFISTIGCAGGSNVTVPSWQREVERYVKERGGGDPAVLRDVTIPDGRRGFAFIGRPEPAQATDVYAVLLAHRAIGGKFWFIYLAGQVEAQHVKTIQLAALSVDGSRFTWRLGAADVAALARYRAFGESEWRQRFPNRADTPSPAYLGFPRADDLFDLTVTEDHLVALERNSGATWELWLSGKAHPLGSGTPKVAARDENSDEALLSELKILDAHSTMHAPQNVASRQ